MSWDEHPWEIVKQRGKESIRQMELMRFYMQQKQDPHGPNLALFVGNLPPNLSQRKYENMLTEFLGNGKQHPLVLHHVIQFIVRSVQNTSFLPPADEHHHFQFLNAPTCQSRTM